MSLLEIDSASVRKNITSGFSLSPSQGQHVEGASERRDGLDLVLHATFVGRCCSHQPSASQRIAEQAGLVVVEDHCKLGVGRELVDAGQHLTLGDIE